MSRYLTQHECLDEVREKQRHAMTLVELLIALVIITFLATILLGAAAVAGETAREARSKQLIARLHVLLMERYDSYRNRRIEAEFDGSGQVLAAQRLHVLRTIMQMEMPDRWSDILNANPQALSSSQLQDIINEPDVNAPYKLARVNESSTSNSSPTIARTALNRLYLRQFSQVDPSDSDRLLLNQSAECLYLTIMYGTAEGEARGLFKENVVGDTDGDGALEFLDGWGNPIRFLRWAKGYDDYSDLQSNDGLTSHDPFDIYRVDINDYRDPTATEEIVTKLIPLIYSAGADEEYGIATNVDVTGNQTSFRFGAVTLSNLRGNSIGQTQLILDPYSKMSTAEGESVYAGTDMDTDAFGRPTGELLDDDEQHVDNLTNHQITAR